MSQTTQTFKAGSKAWLRREYVRSLPWYIGLSAGYWGRVVVERNTWAAVGLWFLICVGSCVLANWIRNLKGAE